MIARTPERYFDFCSSTVFPARIERVLPNARRAPCTLGQDGVTAARAAERHCGLESWERVRGAKAERSILLGIEGFGIVVLRKSWAGDVGTPWLSVGWLLVGGQVRF
jgi:hypothetical protein